jgi:hypothetical protein
LNGWANRLWDRGHTISENLHGLHVTRPGLIDDGSHDVIPGGVDSIPQLGQQRRLRPATNRRLIARLKLGQVRYP